MQATPQIKIYSIIDSNGQPYTIDPEGCIAWATPDLEEARAVLATNGGGGILAHTYQCIRTEVLR